MTDTKYILGTEDDELTRLERQHEVWKKETQTLYSAAEFSEGQTLLDLECGPGFTTLDLQKRVGETGQVIAVDTVAVVSTLAVFCPNFSINRV